MCSILLLAGTWQPRALLRAQLIEEGFDVVATDDWREARSYLKDASKPNVVVVDLEGLPHVQEVLRELSELIEPKHVLVLSALTAVSPAELQRLGFRVAKRPLLVRDVVAAIDRAAADTRGRNT